MPSQMPSIVKPHPARDFNGIELSESNPAIICRTAENSESAETDDCGMLNPDASLLKSSLADDRARSVVVVQRVESGVFSLADMIGRDGPAQFMGCANEL
jgi:hypothetical protein